MAVLALVGVVLLAGCGAARYPDPVSVTAADGRGAIRPLPTPQACTSIATDADAMTAALAKAAPGDRICVLGGIGRRLVLRRSGTAAAPISVLGDGHTSVKGITVLASHITVSGINAIRPWAPGISLTGNDITLENSTSISPRGEDGDGIRFFGDDITIRHNTIRDVRNLHFAHADCMQTFATDPAHPASRHVVIEHNRCERIANQCLIAEGPHSSAGDGSGIGVSADIRFADNYCETHAYQDTEVDDVQHVTIVGNEVRGRKPKAFSFQNHSTGAVVADNVVAPEIDHEVGMDGSSQYDYDVPIIGGKP